MRAARMARAAALARAEAEKVALEEERELNEKKDAIAAKNDLASAAEKKDRIAVEQHSLFVKDADNTEHSVLCNVVWICPNCKHKNEGVHIRKGEGLYCQLCSPAWETLVLEWYGSSAADNVTVACAMSAWVFVPMVFYRGYGSGIGKSSVVASASRFFLRAAEGTEVQFRIKVNDKLAFDSLVPTKELPDGQSNHVLTSGKPLKRTDLLLRSCEYRAERWCIANHSSLCNIAYKCFTCKHTNEGIHIAKGNGLHCVLCAPARPSLIIEWHSAAANDRVLVSCEMTTWKAVPMVRDEVDGVFRLFLRAKPGVEVQYCVQVNGKIILDTLISLTVGKKPDGTPNNVVTVPTGEVPVTIEELLGRTREFRASRLKQKPPISSPLATTPLDSHTPSLPTLPLPPPTPPPRETAAPLPPLSPPPLSAPLIGASAIARATGTKHYTAATAVGVAPVLATPRLTLALTFYRTALDAASHHPTEIDDLAAAAKNASVVTSRLLRSRGNNSNSIDAFADVIHTYALAAAAGQLSGRSNEWLDGIEVLALSLLAEGSNLASRLALQTSTQVKGGAQRGGENEKPLIYARGVVAWATALGGEASGGGAARSSSASGAVRQALFSSIFKGESAHWFAPLTARAHISAVNASIGAMTHLTDLAGVISRDAANTAREDAVERGGSASATTATTTTTLSAAQGETRALLLLPALLIEANMHLETVRSRMSRLSASRMISAATSPDVSLIEEVESLAESIELKRKVFESRSARRSGDAAFKAALDAAVCGDITTRDTMRDVAFDALRLASRLAQDIDIANGAAAASTLGELWVRLPNAKSTAVSNANAFSCFTSSLALARAAEPRSFIDCQWYSAARIGVSTTKPLPIQTSTSSSASISTSSVDSARSSAGSSSSSNLIDAEAVRTAEKSEEGLAIATAASKGTHILIKHIWTHHRPMGTGGLSAPDLEKDALSGNCLENTVSKVMRLIHPERRSQGYTHTAIDSIIFSHLSEKLSVLRT